MKDPVTDWEKIFSNHIQQRTWYQDDIKNSQNSTVDKQTIQLENGVGGEGWTGSSGLADANYYI